MFGGGGGMNPRKMKQMMEQMGIDAEEIDVEEVVIRTGDDDLVFSDADVTRIDARGQQTYQIVGDPETREATADAIDDGEASSSADPAVESQDVEIVAARTGASEADAREALEETDGDLAEAVDRLE